MKQFNKAIFITVRTGSKRLPNKALLKINEKETIVHLMERMKKSHRTDLVVLCTSTNDNDKILRKMSLNLLLPYNLYSSYLSYNYISKIIEELNNILSESECGCDGNAGDEALEYSVEKYSDHPNFDIVKVPSLVKI